MPPVEKKSRSKRFSEWEEKPVKDFDPENEVPDEPENSDSEESADERAGTEHYVSVGKSKLRGKESVNLGPEYRGARVSRAALEQSDEDDDEEEEESEEEEEFADPDTADLELDQVDDDAEISSDDALGESDNEKLKGFVFRGSSKPLKPLSKNLARRPKAADFMQVEESGEEEEGGEDDGVSVSGSEEDEEEEGDLEDYSGEEEEDSELEEREGAMLFDDEAEETDDDSGDDEEEEEESEDDDEEEEDGEDEDDDRAEMRRAMGNEDDVKADIRKAMSDGLKTVVNTISQAAKQEAEQGKAVRTQRRAFDSILNLRIRLQKALIAANTFHVAEKEEDAAPSEAYQAAEEAAVKLWNTIDSVRSSLAPPTKTGEKRKRSAITLDTPTQEIWESMQSLESIALSRRRKVLDKWSSKVRLEAGGGLTKTRRLVDSSSSSSLVSVLEDQLLGNSDRHIKRVRTPRSCAPFQSAKKVEEDSQIYDDADFYQLLLKELVDQRSTDAAAPGGQHVATVRWAAIKEAKTRKVVDRKASKGRKLRYTVHEKLQNFMAPEDRRTWEEHAVDRLFGALFGQKMVLGEEDGEEEEEEDMEMGGVGVNGGEGLKLFGN
ncbi:hypothetical protein QBC37DRAFT_470859 [Rhypophila decipiens]|uniref:Protein BFR2 n=1 Tax=Rhypophila decipiens TaxID=261697 RepID=A0AAN7BDP8_9PEZI|nr:hypothetical protein QBC37DRAFT_470859 [Rhypophila decipiens]